MLRRFSLLSVFSMLVCSAAFAQSTSLSISKAFSPNPPIAGGDVTFTLSVSTEGPDNAANVVVQDVLPPELSYGSVTAPAGWTCDPPAQTIQCTTPSLAPGTAIITIVAHSDPGIANNTTVTNTATVTTTTNDPDQNDNTSSVGLIFQSHTTLTIDKSGPATINAGETITYTIQYGSQGPSNATNVTFNDTLPAGTTFQTINAPGWSCTTTSCTIATLAPGATGTITITALVDQTLAAGTQLTNSAQIGSDNASTVSDSATTNVTTLSNLSVTITDSPDPVFPNSTLTYTVTATNSGPSAATNPQLTINLSPRVTLNSITAPPGWSCVGTTCTTPQMLSGTNAVFTVSTTTASPLTTGEQIVTTATFGSDTDTATTTATNLSMFAVTKSSATIRAEGTTVTYTIVITNSGPQNQANNAGDEMTDTLPSQLTLLSASASSGTASTSGNTVMWNGAIPAGGSVTITVTATINAGTDGQTVSNQATIHYDADGNGTNEGTATSNTDTFTVIPGGSIPTLSTWALIALALTLAMVALRK